MRLIFKTFSMALFGAATPLAAMAHSGHDGVATGGLFTQGILHPLLGMDHLLAMIAVGLVGAIAGGRLIWALPCAFLAAMVAGALLGLTGMTLPAVEGLILTSVILLGAATFIAPRRPAPHALASAALVLAVALFGLFHGGAHGMEAPRGGQVWTYVAGFVFATAALHGLGVMLGRWLPPQITRAAGAVIASLGIALAAIG